MNELIISIFMLLAGLGVLMTGMKMLSEGLERSAESCSAKSATIALQA